MINREQIESALKSKNYVWFEGDWNINIVGVRNSDTGQRVTNSFDDWITVSYQLNNQWNFKCWPATTDPGKKAMLESQNKSGVARLVEGQYRGSHSIGLHKGKYEALRQVKEVNVYRDGDLDLEYDENSVHKGVFGINIHKAGANSVIVENWSEGCQVFQKESDFEEFMDICRQAKGVWGNSFTYTLIESSDLLVS
jgi:hypothetical protein